MDVEPHEPAAEVDERTDGEDDRDGADTDSGAEQVPAQCAAAPKIARLESWPVAPNGARSIIGRA